MFGEYSCDDEKEIKRLSDLPIRPAMCQSFRTFSRIIYSSAIDTLFQKQFNPKVTVESNIVDWIF